MTPDEALSIVDTKAAGRTRFAGMEPYADEVLAAEVRRLRAMELAWEWEKVGPEVWLLKKITLNKMEVIVGSVIESPDRISMRYYADKEIVPCPTLEEAKRQLLEYAQSKCQKP